MLIEQNPRVIEHDVPSIRFHSGQLAFVDGRADVYELMTDGAAMGALGALCPDCSYPHEGKCTWCPEDPAAAQNIPECHRCKGKHRDPLPWHKRSEIVVPALLSAAVTVVATVASTILLERLRKKKARGRG